MRRNVAERWSMRFLEPLSAASTPAAMVRVQTCLPAQSKPQLRRRTCCMLTYVHHIFGNFAGSKMP